MAKNAGRLAGLAALAGAAYMMSKGKDKDKEGPAATAAEKDASEARTKAQRDAVSGNKSAGDKSADNKLETPAETIARSDKSADKYNITDENYSNEGYRKGIIQDNASGTTTLGPGYNKSDKPEPPKSPKSNVRPTDAKKKYPPGVMGGTTQRADASKMYPPGVMGGAKQADTKPSAVKNAVSDAAKTAVNTATKGPATSAKPAASSGSSRVPTPEQAAANRQAAYDKLKSVGSSVADYVRNFETPAERRAREAKNPPPKSTPREFNEDALSTGSAMRRGGMVKKMASGGMTSKVSSASKRADGIASRGKTRCKMY
jgi:hypothetical protein